MNAEPSQRFMVVHFTCPGCGAKCSVADPSTTTHPTVFHDVPTCERFDAIETCDQLTDYVRDARRSEESSAMS